MEHVDTEYIEIQIDNVSDRKSFCAALIDLGYNVTVIVIKKLVFYLVRI